MVTKLQRVIQPFPAAEPEIGCLLAMLADSRDRTRQAVQDLKPAAVDWIGGFNGHCIGTLLYHIAAVEISWLGIEVAEGHLPETVWADFPYEVRDEQGRLTTVKGISLADHLGRLKRVRARLLETYQSMSLAEYRRPRQLTEYDVTPEWVLHHLMQHEAEHRDEIRSLRAAAARELEA
jgi:uncharacterized damage-inducible protein DinB